MVNKFWAIFDENGISVITSVGVFDSQGNRVKPDDEQNWIEVEGDISASSFFKKEGSSIRPFTAEEVAEKNSSMLNNALMFDLRIERKKRLDESDWTQFETTPLSAEKKAEWATYRQALRDLPDTVTNPQSFEWPVPPS